MTFTLTTPPENFGTLLKSWRSRQHVSQLDLALNAGMSQRHISFLETGKSNPSRKAIRQICEVLNMPAAEQDVMLISAGYTPQATEWNWSDGVKAAVEASIDHVLNSHEPYPAVSVNRIWDLQKANESALRFFQHFGGTDQRNLLLNIMSPGKLKDSISNWSQVTRALYRLLELEVVRRPHDSEGKTLLEQLKKLPDVSDAITQSVSEQPSPVLSMELLIDGEVLKLFSLIATIGMSLDPNLDDLRLETLLPADEPTREWFKQR